MTATLERWWTPAGQVPVERLLRPGTDPEKDLGIALLGLHRAGAEACELVAKTAVADEFVLAAALAETRALVAPAAVTTIAKSVESPSYAGLLLKDLLDDAEVAALALYRTCLSKSVAPPIAAERVGAVFGVSSREMSKYARLASDPKANPRAVADLADRTLFDYVAKVVAEEYVPAKETFAKAPTADDPNTPYHDARDAGGQFVAERSAAPAAFLQQLFDRAETDHGPKVGEKQDPSVVTGPAVGQRAQRMKRMGRMKRAAPQRSEQQAASRQSAAQRARQSVFQAMTPQEAALQQMVEPTPLPLSGLPREVPNMMGVDAAPEGQALTENVSFVLSDSELSGVARSAGDLPTGMHVLQLGPLEQYAGKARVYDRGGSTTSDHEDTVNLVKDIIVGGAAYKNQPDLVTGAVDGLELLGADPDGALRKAKEVFLKAKAAQLGLNINVATEISHVQHAPLKTDPSKMALVWRPPGTDESGQRLVQRPVPHVAEIVIPKGTARGTVRSSGGVELDKASALKMLSLFTRHPSSGQRRTYWDPSLGAMRTVVVMEQASTSELEEGRRKKFGKAATPDDPRTRYYDARDESGRFAGDLQALFDQAKARHAEVPLAHPSTPKRMARMGRMKRTGQQTAGQQATQQTTQQRATQLAQQMPAAVTAQQRAHRGTGRVGAEPHLLVDTSGGGHYAALAPPFMYQLMKRAGFSGFAEDVDEDIELDSATRSLVMTTKPSNGSVAEGDLEDHALGYWNLQRKTITSGKAPMHDADTPLAGDVIDEPGELEPLARRILQEMERTHIAAVRVRFEARLDGRVEVKVFGNAEVLPVLHLLSYSDDADPEKPVRLRPGSVRRMHNTASMLDRLTLGYYGIGNERSGLDFIEIANPHVKTWYVD